MTADLARGIFGLLCLLCAIVIITGAWLEMTRVRQGNSLLAPRHYRLRLFSALIWIVNVLSLAGAVTVWWPETNATRNEKWQFISVMNGVFCLTLLGVLFLGIDMWMLSSARRKVEREQALLFSEQLRDLAQKETMRLRGEQAQNPQTSKKVRAYPPQNSSENAPSEAASLDQI